MSRVYKEIYKERVIQVSSENMFKSSMKTVNPKQVWSYSIDGSPAGEGYGSRKDAFESAFRLIDRRIEKRST